MLIKQFFIETDGKRSYIHRRHICTQLCTWNVGSATHLSEIPPSPPHLVRPVQLPPHEVSQPPVFTGYLHVPPFKESVKMGTSFCSKQSAPPLQQLAPPLPAIHSYLQHPPPPPTPTLIITVSLLIHNLDIDIRSYDR